MASSASRSARLVDQVSDLHARAVAFETLFMGQAGTIPEATALHAVARRAIAREESLARRRRSAGRVRTSVWI